MSDLFTEWFDLGVAAWLTGRDDEGLSDQLSDLRMIAGLAGPAVGDRLWRNAEEFLEYVERAALDGEGSTSWRYLESLLARASAPPTIDKLPRLCRRYLVAACEQSVVDQDVLGTEGSPERWEPYLRWGDRVRLGPFEDHVITFNYDRIADIVVGRNSAIPVVFPPHGGHLRGADVLIYKLHGSVLWELASSENGKQEVRIVSDRPVENAICAKHEVAIFGPSPKKGRVTNTLLGSPWREAEDALRRAEEVNIVGFSFPPSDAAARSRIVSCLMEASKPEDQKSKLQKIRVVLGPDRRDPNVRRVRWLMERAVGDSKKVEVVPAWAEDFIDSGS